MKPLSQHSEETGSQKILRFQIEGFNEFDRSGTSGDLILSSNEEDEQMKPETVLKNELRHQGALLGILTTLCEQQLTLANLAITSTGEDDQISQTEEVLGNKLHDQGRLLEILNALHEQLLELVPGKLLQSE